MSRQPRAATAAAVPSRRTSIAGAVRQVIELSVHGAATEKTLPPSGLASVALTRNRTDCTTPAIPDTWNDRKLWSTAVVLCRAGKVVVRPKFFVGCAELTEASADGANVSVAAWTSTGTTSAPSASRAARERGADRVRIGLRCQ